MECVLIMEVKSIPLGLIRTDGGTQMRVALDQDVYLDYRDKWLAGVEFDPVELFHDGSAYWLADGFHRFYGAREAKLATIKARVHQGTQRDAILFATGANPNHGLRRSNRDKRLATVTLLQDVEWGKWSDAKIAEQASVTRQFVSDLRRELATVATSTDCLESEPETRVGKDGKSYPVRPPKKKSTSIEPGEDPPEPQHKPKPTQPQAESKSTPFDEPLAALDWVLTVVVPKTQEHAIMIEEALGNAKGDFTRQRVSRLVEPIHKLFTNARGVLANAQQKARKAK